MTGVAIVGASGYASRDLIRILLNHPGARITVATSDSAWATPLDPTSGTLDLPELLHHEPPGPPRHVDRVLQIMRQAHGSDITATLRKSTPLRTRRTRRNAGGTTDEHG